MKKAGLFWMFWITIATLVNAATNNAADMAGVIKGIVIDVKTQQPIEYATIALHNSSGTLVTGAVSNMAGEFKINGVADGSYYAMITFLGYETKRFDNLVLSASKRTIDMGRVELKSSATELQAVEIVADKKAFEYKIDKKVINVGKQATAASMTAIEVLENVPSVKVDIEGNVSLRGSSGFTVLIDGKPTILEGSDALRQIPASSIENIEIITNPSAKYQPDGTAGIINVITKKNRMEGINGQANINVGRFGTYGGDFLLNKRQKNVNVYLGADYNDRIFKGENESRRMTLSNNNQDTLLLNANGDSKREMVMWGIRTGIEVDINKKNSATLGFRYGKQSMDNSSVNDYQKYTSASKIFDDYISRESGDRGGDFLSLTGTFLHQFEGMGHDIRAQLDVSSRSGDENSYKSLYRGALVEASRNQEGGPAKRGQLRIDYTRPFSENNKLELGYQGRISKEDNKTSMDTFDIVNQLWIEEANYTNKSNENQQIHAFYSTYSGMWGKLGYQAGVRGEYNYRVIATNNKDFTLDRFDVYPTLHFSYQLPKEHQIMASYARRLERTRGWLLEPFVTWQDAYNVRQGNPDIVPQFIDSYELAYIKQFAKSYFSFEGYYRTTHNKVEMIQRKWEGDPNGTVMMRQPFNVGRDYSLGIESNLNIKQLKWWELNLMGNIYQYEVEGKVGNLDFSNSTFNWGARFNNTFIPTKNMQLQFNGNFNSPTATAQGRTEGYYSFDAAFRVDMLNRKLAAVIQARDLFATGVRESTTSGSNFYLYSKNSRRAPMISCTLTFRFNNYMPKRQMRNDSEGGEETNGGGEDF
jgi:hypothetical protein